MAPGRSDSVFLLTLVDFLVQIIFFGLLLFVFYKSSEGHSKTNATPEQVGKAIDAAGVSNIVELTDELTKLAPVGLKGFNERLTAGQKDVDVKAAADAIGKAGGGAGLPAALERLEKFEGSERPPCLATTIGGKRQPLILASAVGSAATITFQGETPQLRTLLSEIGVTYQQVQSLPFSRFRVIFNRVLEKHPACRYTIQLRETTGMVYARDAAQQIFYTQLRR